MLFHQVLALENARAHLDPKRFGFIAAGDHAAIIIAEHDQDVL